MCYKYLIIGFGLIVLSLLVDVKKAHRDQEITKINNQINIIKTIITNYHLITLFDILNSFVNELSVNPINEKIKAIENIINDIKIKNDNEMFIISRNLNKIEKSMENIKRSL